MIDRAMVAKVWLRAAELLEELGWCARTPSTGDGRVCLVTAFSRAVFQLVPEDDGPLWVAARQAAVPLIGGGPFWRWNDAPWRTEDEVVQLCRDVAARAAS